jgi:hypothetical protein
METIMSLSLRTTRRFQIEQLETRVTPSALNAAGILAHAKPMVSDINVPRHTDQSSTNIVTRDNSNGQGNVAAQDAALTSFLRFKFGTVF